MSAIQATTAGAIDPLHRKDEEAEAQDHESGNIPARASSVKP